MREEQDPWNKLADMFSSNSSEALAADNVDIAWPVIREAMPRQASVLDFGCGTGTFCRHLDPNSYQVTGLDRSAEMISAAKKEPSQIRYIEGGYQDIPDQLFEVIVSTMVLQFIREEDLPAVAQALSTALVTNGRLILTVYNPAFAEACLESKQFFSQRGDQLLTSYGQNSLVDTFIRSEEQYQSLFEKLGLKLESSTYPPFTEEFIQKYKWELPHHVSEFLIMVFSKKDSQRIKATIGETRSDLIQS